MIQERLFALRDEKYREFQRSLIPGLPRENIIGIRIPVMRKLAKEFVKEPEDDTNEDTASADEVAETDTTDSSESDETPAETDTNQTEKE